VRAAALLVLAACGGATGTLDVALATAPGSTVLDPVQTLRLTVTSPHRVYEASRDDEGHFRIDVDFDANGQNGALIVDGLDDNGAIIATGQSPPFPIAALNAKVVVYMAAPMSIAEAPNKLKARSQLAASPLSYGVVFAGGLDASGGASDQLDIYNTYDHSITPGLAMPQPRSAAAIAIAGTAVYLFGGADSSTPSDTLTRFDTNVAPSGSYADLTQSSWPAEFARDGQIAVQIDAVHFAISGTPPLELNGADGSLVAYPNAATLPPVGTTALPPDQVLSAIFAGDGIVQLRGEDIVDVSGVTTSRTGHAIAGVSDGRVVIIGGAESGTPTRDAILVEPAAHPTASVKTNLLAIARMNPAVTATSDFLIVAGGTAMDGSLVPDAELFDTVNVAPVMTIPLVVPRTGAVAIPMQNHQIMIVGGVDAAGAPIDTIELFTPAPTQE
jgi:hypothetical protein